MTINLRFTGKNSDGEYWLHLEGSTQKAGLNLGDPAGMITSAMLMAASGRTYICADRPELVALVHSAEKLLEAYSAIFGTGNPWGDELRAALAAWKGGV